MDESNEFERNLWDNKELSGEQAERAEAWDEAMESGVPEFAGEDFGAKKKEGSGVAPYNETLADASALGRDGVLNKASQELGVEHVVQGVVETDTSGDNPMGELYERMGVNTTEERNDAQMEAEVAEPKMAALAEKTGTPNNAMESAEDTRVAIGKMKELANMVEADPRFEDLRAGARAAGVGYYEYAVKHLGTQGLTELFDELAKQKEEKSAVPEMGAEESIKEEKVEEVVEQAGLTGEVAEKVTEEVKEEMAEETNEEGAEPGFENNNAESETETEEDIQKKVEEKIKQMENLNPEILGPDNSKPGE